MQQLLKRLELIKTGIELDDEEIVTMQIRKLEEAPEPIAHIVSLLKTRNYGSAILAIEEYLERYRGVVEYVDPQVQGLRLELKSLEAQLQELEAKKSESLNEIDDFTLRYNVRFGVLIKKILELEEALFQRRLRRKHEAFEARERRYRETKEEVRRYKDEVDVLEEELEKLDEFDDAYEEAYERYKRAKERLEAKEEELARERKKAKEAKEALEDDPLNDAYEETKRDRETFDEDYESARRQQERRCDLNEDEAAELKKLYREASRLCHPDIVEEAFREQATETMQQLNEAYADKDLARVRKLLEALKSGTIFTLGSDVADDAELLGAKIAELREKIATLEKEIERIHANEAFRVLEETDDLESYFDRVERELRAKRDDLEAELNHDDQAASLRQSSVEGSRADSDDYWQSEF